MQNTRIFLGSRVENYSLFRKLQNHLSEKNIERYSESSIDPWAAIFLELPKNNDTVDLEKAIALRLDGLDSYHAILFETNSRPKRVWRNFLKGKAIFTHRWIKRNVEPGYEGIFLFHISGIIIGFKEKDRIEAVREKYRLWLKENFELLSPLVGKQLVENNPTINAKEIEKLSKSFKERYSVLASNTNYSCSEPSLSFLIKTMQKNNHKDISPNLVKLIWGLGFGELLWDRKKKSRQDNTSMSTYIEKSKKYQCLELKRRFPVPGGGYTGLTAGHFI